MREEDTGKKGGGPGGEGTGWKYRVARWGEGGGWMREEDTGGREEGQMERGQGGSTEWPGGEREGVR